MEKRADYLFEVSWEICNKVGGIHTVVKSKAAQMKDIYRENYYVIGPFFAQKIPGEFDEKAPPKDVSKVFEILEKEGIRCYYGDWLVKGEPRAILIDFSGFTYKKDEIKARLWEGFKIDSLHSQFFDFDEPTIWAYAAGRLIHEMKKAIGEKRVVAQFHEWLSGAGLLYLKQNNAGVATVFTTHATMLGRTICTNHLNLYSIWDKINPEQKAYEFGIQAKYQTEKACAFNSDAFTTVSELTGIEAKHLLGKKPDVILLNGLDLSKFPTFEEASIRHIQNRTKLREFIMYYFFPYYSFDLEKTLIYFICGRYEFKDKGVDVFIRALAKLNQRLKNENSDKTVVAFFWIPGDIKGIKNELIENRSFFDDIKDAVEGNIVEIKNKIIYSIVSQKPLDEKGIFDDDMIHDNKRKVSRLMKKGFPALSTHDLNNEDTDEIMKTLRENGLLNNKEDRVKVVFYPIYLTGADRLLDMSYYECMQGSHLGVFPSYYEPWGYTPLEAAALGVSSVTTDLAGFGRHITKKLPKGRNKGIFVLKRMGKKEEEIINELDEIMYYLSNASKQDRIKNKMEAQRLASLADWKFFVKNYIRAHNFAIENIEKQRGA